MFEFIASLILGGLFLLLAVFLLVQEVKGYYEDKKSFEKK